MSALPWVRFFPSDWLAGTRGLSAAETGVYITLIMMMYDRGGPLTDDAPRLARLCGSQVNHFNSALAALIEQGKLYRTDEGALFNQRVRQEGESGRDFASLQSARRKSGWDKKPKENNGDPIPDDNRKPTENIPYHNQKPEKKELPPAEGGARAKKPVRLPADFDLPSEEAVAVGLEPSRVPEERAKFRDHWLAAPGGKGLKQDWLATWRNWCRRAAADYRPSTGPPNSNGRQSGGDYIRAAMSRLQEPPDEPDHDIKALTAH
jgi:uncharacterized protein YdaU (DUF1376 family)